MQKIFLLVVVVVFFSMNLVAQTPAGQFVKQPDCNVFNVANSDKEGDTMELMVCRIFEYETREPGMMPAVYIGEVKFTLPGGNVLTFRIDSEQQTTTFVNGETVVMVVHQLKSDQITYEVKKSGVIKNHNQAEIDKITAVFKECRSFFYPLYDAEKNKLGGYRVKPEQLEKRQLPNLCDNIIWLADADLAKTYQ